MASIDRAMVAAANEVERIKLRTKKAAEAHKKEMAQVTNLAIAGGTTGLLSYLDGRAPDRMQVAKIPVSAVLAGGIVAGELFGLLPDDERIFAVGLGATCAYTAKLGLQKGQAARQQASQQAA